jgi:hypothetical protein
MCKWDRINEDTRRLVEGYFERRGLGPTEIKGVAGSINVYQAVRIGAFHGHFEIAAQRGLSKFVGREREPEEMRHALEPAVGGHGQIVGVMAEAGIGKSPLLYEFKATTWLVTERTGGTVRRRRAAAMARWRWRARSHNCGCRRRLASTDNRAINKQLLAAISRESSFGLF